MTFNFLRLQCIKVMSRKLCQDSGFFVPRFLTDFLSYLDYNFHSVFLHVKWGKNGNTYLTGFS